MCQGLRAMPTLAATLIGDLNLQCAPVAKRHAALRPKAAQIHENRGARQCDTVSRPASLVG